MQKKARGYMANYLITNKVTDPEALSNFKENGYQYSKSDSTSEKPVFAR